MKLLMFSTSYQHLSLKGVQIRLLVIIQLMQIQRTIHVITVLVVLTHVVVLM